jgi:ATP-dependent DNA helicase RecG
MDSVLLEIARPIRESSMTRSPGLMDRTILSLCDGQYLTLRELSALLNRGPNKLRDKYLKRLVETGDIELLYRDIPNHKQQAYRKRQQ